MYARFGLLAATLLMAFGVLEGVPTASLVAIVVVSLVAARYAGRRILRSDAVVRVRAHARRQTQRAAAAPQHPHTPGRRRSRAPSQSMAAAQ